MNKVALVWLIFNNFLKIYKRLMNLIRIISLIDVFLSFFFLTWSMCHDKFTQCQHFVVVLRPHDYLITHCQNMGWSGKSGTTFSLQEFILWFFSCYGDCLIKQCWIWLRLTSLEARSWNTSHCYQYHPHCHSIKTVVDFIRMCKHV